MQRKWGFALIGLAWLAIPAAGVQAETVAVAVGAGVVGPRTGQSLGRETWWTGSLRFPLMESFFLQIEGGYWKRPPFEGESGDTFKDWQWGGTFLFSYPAGPALFYTGVGGAWHRLSGTLPGLELSPNVGTQSRLGVHFVGGMELRLQDHVAVFGAARYAVVFNYGLKQWYAYGGVRLVL